MLRALLLCAVAAGALELAWPGLKPRAAARTLGQVEELTYTTPLAIGTWQAGNRLLYDYSAERDPELLAAWALASDAAGSFLFSAAADGPVLRHALPSFRALSPLDAHPFGTSALAAVEDAHGRVLLASGGFKDCEVWVRVVSEQEGDIT